MPQGAPLVWSCTGFIGHGRPQVTLHVDAKMKEPNGKLSVKTLFQFKMWLWLGRKTERTSHPS